MDTELAEELSAWGLVVGILSTVLVLLVALSLGIPARAHVLAHQPVEIAMPEGVNGGPRWRAIEFTCCWER